MAILGYARVSTDDQRLEMQLEDLQKAGVEERNIYQEKISGAADRLPERERLLQYVREGDTVYIWKLTRLGRSLSELIRISLLLQDKGVQLISVKEMIDTGTIQGRLFYNLCACFAEYLRETIVENTKAGLQSARKRGTRLGRPRALSDEHVEVAVGLLRRNMSLREAARHLGCSHTTLSNAVKRFEAQNPPALPPQFN